MINEVGSSQQRHGRRQCRDGAKHKDMDEPLPNESHDTPRAISLGIVRFLDRLPETRPACLSVQSTRFWELLIQIKAPAFIRVDECIFSVKEGRRPIWRK